MQTIDWSIIRFILSGLIFLILIYYLGRYTFCKRISHFLTSISFRTKYFLIGFYKEGLSYHDRDLLPYKYVYLFITSNGIGIHKVNSLRKAIFLPYKNIRKIEVILRDKKTSIPVDEDNLPVFMRDLTYILIEYMLDNVKQQELLTISFNGNDNIYPFNNYIYTKLKPLKEIKKYVSEKLMVSEAD